MFCILRAIHTKLMCSKFMARLDAFNSAIRHTWTSFQMYLTFVLLNNNECWGSDEQEDLSFTSSITNILILLSVPHSLVYSMTYSFFFSSSSLLFLLLLFCLLIFVHRECVSGLGDDKRRPMLYYSEIQTHTTTVKINTPYPYTLPLYLCSSSIFTNF